MFIWEASSWDNGYYIRSTMCAVRRGRQELQHQLSFSISKRDLQPTTTALSLCEYNYRLDGHQ